MTHQTQAQLLARQMIDLPEVISAIRTQVEADGECSLDHALEMINDATYEAVETELTRVVEEIRDDLREARIQDEERRIIASTY